MSKRKRTFDEVVEMQEYAMERFDEAPREIKFRVLRRTGETDSQGKKIVEAVHTETFPTKASNDILSEFIKRCVSQFQDIERRVSLAKQHREEVMACTARWFAIEIWDVGSGLAAR